ncbi:MAG: GNAT family N-acetyltransferase [Bacillota bacterium]
MEIKQGDNQFYVLDDLGDTVGNITWTPSDEPNIIIANHTFVDPKMRGQNVARILLDKLAAYARKNDLKIHPTCSYVARIFEKEDSYDDIKA